MSKAFRTIAGNSFATTLADPFFLVLHLALLILSALLSALPGFTQGEHVRLLRDQSLALLFMVGCLAVIFGMIRSVTDDFRRGAGSVLMSRPINPFGLLLGKWSGVVGAVFVLSLSGAICSVWLAEVAGNGDELNRASLITYFTTLTLAIVIGGVRHYLLRGNFPTWANYVLLGSLILGFGVRLAISPNRDHFDWPAMQGAFLLFLALAAFAAIILPVALMLDSALVLAVGITIFFGGLISHYLVTSAIGNDLAARAIAAITPNWQIYWVADRLGQETTVPTSYFVSCGIHAVGFIILFTTISTLILSRMEVRNDG